MSKVCVAVKLTIKAGMRDAFDVAVAPGLATAEGEAGTLMYAYHHDAANESVVWFWMARPSFRSSLQRVARASSRVSRVDRRTAQGSGCP